MDALLAAVTFSFDLKQSLFTTNELNGQFPKAESASRLACSTWFSLKENKNVMYNIVIITLSQVYSYRK